MRQKDAINARDIAGAYTLERERLRQGGADQVLEWDLGTSSAERCEGSALRVCSAVGDVRAQGRRGFWGYHHCHDRGNGFLARCRTSGRGFRRTIRIHAVDNPSAVHPLLISTPSGRQPRWVEEERLRAQRGRSWIRDEHTGEMRQLTASEMAGVQWLNDD
jgi:hypothetical protein